MKVLFVIDQIAHGGAERILVDYYHYLESQGVDVKVFVLSGNAEQSVWSQGLDVCYAVDEGSHGLLGKFCKAFVIVGKLRELHKEFAPDAVFSFLEKSNMLASFLPKCSKKVFSVHNVLSIQYLKIRNNFVRSLWYRFLRSRYNSGKGVVLAVSEQVKEDLVSSLGVDVERIVVVDNRVNRADIIAKSEEEVIDFCFEENVKYIMNIGRFSNQKAQWKLIKAFSLVSKELKENVELVLMGSGENEPLLKDLVKDLSLESKVHILPFKENPYKYLKHASLFVLSSLYEGFPIVVAETSAIGVPFVGSERAVPKEMFDSMDFREKCLFKVCETDPDFSTQIGKDDRSLADLLNRVVCEEHFRKDLFNHIRIWNEENDVSFQFEKYSHLLGIS